MISAMPSVAISGLTSSLVIISPFSVPTTAPISSTARIAGSIIAGSPFMIAEETTADAEIRCATDRSIEPTRIAKVWPTAVMPSAMERLRTETAASGVRKRVRPRLSAIAI